MKNLTQNQINKILKKKFDIEKSWLYNQFHKTYEKNIWVFEITLEKAVDKFLKFLRFKGIQKILFFPEPTFDFEEVGAKILDIGESEGFLLKHVSTITNNHIADLNLDWIFTFGHEEDFLISGKKEFVDIAVKYFKNVKLEESLRR